MGQASSGLTQYDVEELISASGGVFSQAEIEGLYKRFRALDRGHKGYVAGDELLNIPELSINPVAQRAVRLFESANFREFCRLLAAFSNKAPRSAKISLMFDVYDMDGDGIVGRDDLSAMLRQLAGSSLSEGELSDVVDGAMAQAGPESQAKGGLDLKAFTKALEGADLSNMVVEMPREW